MKRAISISAAMSRRGIMGMMLAMALKPRLVFSATTIDSEALFSRPPASARPWVRWWWPGADVSEAEIGRELALLESGGFGGAEVQPFTSGLDMKDPQQKARIDRYATPAFFSLMRFAMEEAGRRGLLLDYNFGSAWPVGGGSATTPERALRELTMAVTEVKNGAVPVHLSLPSRTRKLGGLNKGDPQTAAWQKRFDAIDKIVAVIAVQGTGPDLVKPKAGLNLFPWRDVKTPGQLDPSTTLVLTDKLRADGTLDWAPPPGTWQIFVFKEYAADAGLLAAAGEGPQLTADHFDEAAFAAQAARVGDPLVASVGRDHAGWHGIFVDSLELMPDIYWSRDFLEEFRWRRGYDLTPWLPFILQPGWMQSWNQHYSPPYYEAGSAGDRVRADYRMTVSDLLIERFITPYVSWGRKAGVAVRLQAHGAPADILRAYGMADIPETEDLEESANPYFMRLARSAANLYGRSIVSAESLCWRDRPFSVTPAEMRQRADRIFASGVNRLVIHGFPYAYQEERWPGWHPFAPTGFSKGYSTFLSDRNPVWPGLTQLAAYLTRMQAILQQGRSVVPVALFLNEIGYFDGIETHGQHGNEVEAALIAGGYDYDRINAHSLATARMEKGALVTRGGARYEVLVLPAIDALRAETAEKIAAFARAGLPVFFVDRVPEREIGWLDHQQRDARVRAAMDGARSTGARPVAVASLVQAIRSAGADGNLRFRVPSPDLIFVEREIGGRHYYFIHNMAADGQDATFSTKRKGPVSQFDAMTGHIGGLPVTADGEWTHIGLTLGAGRSALIEIGGASRTPPRSERQVAEQMLPGDKWHLSVNGHASGGRPMAADVPLDGLKPWSSVPGLENFAGAGRYATSLSLPADWRGAGGKIVLDLGEVHDVAVVTVNGTALPPLIESPWHADISSLVREGANEIVVTVYNVPQNALIDRSRPGYRDLAMMPAGLVGPVKASLFRS